MRRRLVAALPAEVEVRDQHRSHVVLAVQGPDSDAVLEGVGLPVGHPYMGFATASFEGHEVTVCRTGYTGERGYELVADAEVGPACGTPCWPRASRTGWCRADWVRATPSAPRWATRCTARTSASTSRPCRPAWVVRGLGQAGLWGREVLRAERERGADVTLRGLVAQGRGIARPQMSVKLTRDLPVGHVTSGTFSPTLRKGVALALVNSQVQLGAEVLVDVRGRAETFLVTKPPFVETDVR